MMINTKIVKQEAIKNFKMHLRWRLKLTDQEADEYAANRKNWTAEDKTEYKNEYSCAYHREKQRAKRKASIFWTETMDNGCIKQMFEEMGLEIRNGKTRCINSGEQIVEWYIREKVLPRLEEQFNITGVKLRSHPTANSTDLLDWTKADIKK
jgi:hypothetical protein